MTLHSSPETTPSTPEHWLEHFPVTFFASVMGLAGLTLALHAAEMQAGGPALASRVALAATVALFLALAGLYSLKLMRHPAAVIAEWRHPVKLAFFPALSISLLLIGTALLPALPGLARIVWLVGAAAQAALTLAVLSNWIGHRPFQTIHISPAWFIPAVGNVIAPIAGVALGYPELSWLFFSAGMTFWIVLLVLVMNRLMFHDPMPGRLVPTLAILIAPPALGFLAWLQLNGGQVDGLARYLYGTAVVFAALTLTQAGQLRGQPFALSWWALSFPVAALTVATFSMAALADSVAHGRAGWLCLMVLIGIIGALVLRTGRAIARNEICRPD